MIADRVRSFLDKNQVKYAVIQHSPAFTAPEIAASAHVPGREMAKSVMVKIEDRFAMIVLPSSKRVSLDEVQRIVGTEKVRLAHEHEFEKLFPDCEAGAMPPFGNLYALDVYVHPALTQDEMIAFNAGSHTEILRMRYADFERLAQPKALTMV
jgi:Ala-tRNA(Pro) deacylase